MNHNQAPARLNCFTLAHLSDIHLSPMQKAQRSSDVEARPLGYVNWHRGRKLVHRRDILDILTRDISSSSSQTTSR
jgi:hypothetical protein